MSRVVGGEERGQEKRGRKERRGEGTGKDGREEEKGREGRRGEGRGRKNPCEFGLATGLCNVVSISMFCCYCPV